MYEKRMRLLIPISALLLGLADSQNLSGQPACATSCIISAVQAAGCLPQDLSCQCGPTKAVIGASAAPCLLAACTGTELVQAQSAGNAQCSSYSATATAAVADNHVGVVLARPTRGNTLFDDNNNDNNMEENLLLNARSETTPTLWVARDHEAPSNPLEDLDKRQIKVPSSPARLNAVSIPTGVVPFDIKKFEPEPNPPPRPLIEEEEEESKDSPQRQPAEDYRITMGMIPEVVQLVQQKGVFPAMATAAPAARDHVFGRSDDEDEDEDEEDDDTDDVLFVAQVKNGGKNDGNENEQQQEKKRFVVVTLVPVQKPRATQEREEGLVMMQKGEPTTVDQQGLFMPLEATVPDVAINTMPLREEEEEEEEEVNMTVVHDVGQKKVEAERDNRNAYTWLQVNKAEKSISLLPVNAETTNRLLPVNAEASNTWLKLLNEAAVATTSTGRVTTTYTSTSTSTSTVTSTVHSASTGAAAAGAAKLGGGALGGLLGVVGVMVFGM
ncbi:hypothetical protein QBC43DRAFT_348982 [Cladorrhinum sp. PSN259]|nr:hypothetical protein QBC43DRAFT_348982 [Cladorrhinum sp. PSN259]